MTAPPADAGSEARACYEALIDQDSGELKDEVKEMIGEDASFSTTFF